MAHHEFAGEDIIDVRDIIARVEELREERDSYVQEMDDLIDQYNQLEADDNSITQEEINAAKKSVSDWREDNHEELAELESILSDLKGYGGDEQWEGDWYPVTLIHENYFEQSMDEMVADCYELPKNIPAFMTLTIDYDMLKQDYSEVEIDGDTYYYR